MANIQTHACRLQFVKSQGWQNHIHQNRIHMPKTTFKIFIHSPYHFYLFILRSKSVQYDRKLILALSYCLWYLWVSWLFFDSSQLRYSIYWFGMLSLYIAPDYDSVSLSTFALSFPNPLTACIHACRLQFANPNDWHWKINENSIISLLIIYR